MEKYEDNFEIFLKKFQNTVLKLGYKNSIQKDYILKILYFNDEHLSIEQIISIAKINYKVNISIATAYKTIKFFEELNIVNSLDIKAKTKKYELNVSLHHDHLICTLCNKIIEFYDEVIEEQQKKVAKNSNFILKDHIMTIYGLCKDCQ